MRADNQSKPLGFQGVIPSEYRQASFCVAGLMNASEERARSLISLDLKIPGQVSVGVGVARGFATLGIIGSENRVDYAAIGPVTNLAASLCNNAKDGEIIFDLKTYDALRLSHEITKIGFVSLTGFVRPVETFKLIRGASMMRKMI